MSIKSAAKKVIGTKSPVSAAAKKVRPEVKVALPAAKSAPAKKAAAAKKAPTHRTGLRVSVGVAPGGYKVFGTALQPKHRTPAEIAAAVAALD